MRAPHPPSSSPSGNLPELISAMRERRQKTRADEELCRRVREAFEAEDDASTRSLHFYVFEGAVSIYGAVATYAVRDQIMGAVASLQGVRHIADHLTVLS